MTLSQSHEGIASKHPAILVAGGRISGTEHVRTGRACQDAFAWWCTDGYALAVVCDGCGSGRYSETGAQLGARLWTAALAAAVSAGALRGATSDRELLSRLATDIWPGVRARVTARLAALADDMGAPVADVIVDHFLFTLVGAVMTPGHTVIYSLGDGAYGIDDEVHEIGPYPDNRPPYLGYDLIENRPVHPIAVHECRPTDTVCAVVLATDGIGPLLASDQSADQGLLQFSNPRYVRNKDAIRRRLSTLNQEHRAIDWEARVVARQAGIFRDDVAVVTIQRRPEAGA